MTGKDRWRAQDRGAAARASCADSDTIRTRVAHLSFRPAAPAARVSRRPMLEWPSRRPSALSTKLSYTRKFILVYDKTRIHVAPCIRMPKSTVPVPPPTDTAPQLDHQTVGARLRDARKSRGLTLAQLSERSGIAVSTISKAERGDIALTYDKFAALTHALALDFDTMFGRPAPAGAMTPSFTPAGQQMVYDTPNYAYGMLANDLTGKRMVPVRGRIHARKLSDFADYIRHSGEEFVFVLSGELELRFENGHAYRLGAGDSLYFDSAVGHVYLSLGDADAEVLACCVDGDARRPRDAI
ncbi:transcriptional regulator, XRE family with cupin sensor [Burkholderia sp. AU4i]|nr:transcriptional regulator, XRE family with cupin sensor [Burkholderia sp. AU4i]